VEAIYFKLSGKTAFFKKPDVNVNTYFTYNNIHKVALLGILGAVIGLGGHIQQSRKLAEKGGDQEYPEFYNKLKNLKVAIIPFGERGYFTKKIQVFNNGVGYASKEAGGNLIVREQWLENPAWGIYLLNNGGIEEEIFVKLRDYLLSKRCTYVPYLGKNDHPAVISNCEVVELQEEDMPEKIDSLFQYDQVVIGELPASDDEAAFFFKEFSPVALSANYNYYEFRELSYTNLMVEETEAKDIYIHDDRVLFFF
jgi:CRISPR-associated protein Cas5h